MLAADKLQLQSAFKQQATALKEKEFQLHHSNLMTVGTQAAVLASLDVTMFIEFQPPHDSEWGSGHYISRSLKFFYFCLITTAFCCNLLVVAQTTMLSVLGSGLALRGPDGSMITATDGLYEERKPIYAAFAVGLATTIASVVVVVWLILSPEAAVICMCITIVTCMRLYKSYLRIQSTFEFDESETVDFSDMFDTGPAAGLSSANSSVVARRKKQSNSSSVTTGHRQHHSALKQKQKYYDGGKRKNSDGHDALYVEVIENHTTPLRGGGGGGGVRHSRGQQRHIDNRHSNQEYYTSPNRQQQARGRRSSMSSLGDDDDLEESDDFRSSSAGDDDDDDYELSALDNYSSNRNRGSRLKNKMTRRPVSPLMTV